jgi:hypothetical protein
VSARGAGRLPLSPRAPAGSHQPTRARRHRVPRTPHRERVVPRVQWCQTAQHIIGITGIGDARQCQPNRHLPIRVTPDPEPSRHARKQHMAMPDGLEKRPVPGISALYDVLQSGHYSCARDATCGSRDRTPWNRTAAMGSDDVALCERASSPARDRWLNRTDTNVDGGDGPELVVPEVG